MLTRPYDPTSDSAVVADLVADDLGLSEAKFLDLRRGDAVRGFGVVGTMERGVVGYAHALPIAENGVWAIEVVIAAAERSPQAYGELTRSALAGLPAGVEARVWASHEYHVAAAVDADLEPIRELRRLGRALPPDQVPAFPDGVELHPFRSGDEDEWIRVNNAAFAKHPENQGWDRPRLAETMALPWFDPTGLILAWEGDALVGSCWTKVHDDGAGEIYIIGVAPDQQGRGMGRALSLAGLWHLASDRGLKRAILYADAANSAGNAMYEHLGFAIEQAAVEFRASSAQPKR